MNNIEDKSNRYCTGCGACTVVCPVEAIEYKLNNEGFFQAFINKDKCINCGKCKKVCAKFLKQEELGEKLETGKLYSAQSKNKETVKSCTSGGIAYEIAKYGIQNGYKILGTIYDYEKHKAKAIIAQTIEEIELLKGSKYIQSDTSEAIEEMVKDCKNNIDSKYMIFGTPCQIAGISKMIEVNEIKNEIIKIDLFCHGVPSYLIWKQYIKYLERKGIKKIDKVVFRSKHIGWHDFCIEIKDGDSIYYGPCERDLFYKTFFDNVLLNSACFNCINRSERTLADIRLGDYWGKRYIDRQDGISAVLINTEIGKNIIEELKKNKITIIEETTFQECAEYQSVNKKYKYFELHNAAIQELKKQEKINKVIKNYRKKMSYKYQLKIKLKEFTGILPNKLRAKIRNIKHKI